MLSSILKFTQPPCHPRCSCLSFFRKKKKVFWGKHFRIFLNIVDLNSGQWVEGSNCHFNALQKALHDRSQGIRVISCITICHFLKNKNDILFIHKRSSCTISAMCMHKRHALHNHIKKACTRLVFCLCTSVQKGRIGRNTLKSSNIVVLPFFVKDVWLSLHVRFVNTGSVVLSTLLVTFPTWLCNAWCRAFVVKKHIHIYIYIYIYIQTQFQKSWDTVHCTLFLLFFFEKKEVANRVSCGSFRGGHWYLPFRNHDNRYFADWIRLYPGLSKNSENGNSCPKPHKAARMIEAVGRAVSIETETIIAIWILPRRSSRLYKGKLIKMRPKWTKTDRE